jgi:hypothetical protein
LNCAYASPRWTHGVEKRAQILRDRTDYFGVIRMFASHRSFETAYDLRGAEPFLMDTAVNPEFAHAALIK